MEREQDDSSPERGDDAFAPEELRAISDDVSAGFPPPRLGTELVLLEVDPQRAHAYWNIDLEDYNDARLDSGKSALPLVLRMYDVTGIQFDGANAAASFDIEVQGLQGQWYVDLWRPGRDYVAEIGFRRADHSLAFIARSNPVATPAAGPSEKDDRAPPELVTAAAATRLTVLSRDTVTEDSPGPLQNEYPKYAGAPGAVVPAPAPAAAEWPAAESMAEELPGVRKKLDEFYKELTAPESAITVAESRMEREMEGESPVPGAPEVPATPAPLPLESYVNLSSFEHARPQVDLEINTELHVYGRAKPGSDLTFFGQKVPLRPDGTFFDTQAAAAGRGCHPVIVFIERGVHVMRLMSADAEAGVPPGDKTPFGRARGPAGRNECPAVI